MKEKAMRTDIAENAGVLVSIDTDPTLRKIIELKGVIRSVARVKKSSKIRKKRFS